jgi:Glutathione S-transferase, N-terminal domain
MAKIKLTYFDFHGGRGEPARLALSIGGIVFEDDRVAASDWERRKAYTPFGALPVLEVDGQIVAQSNAINRYVGKLAALYPSDPWQAALCDEAMENRGGHHQQDRCNAFPSGRAKEGAAKGARRLRDPILSYPATAAARSTRRPVLRRRPLVGRGSQDLRMDPAPSVRSTRSCATDLPDRVAPKLIEHYERVKERPGGQSLLCQACCRLSIVNRRAPGLCTACCGPAHHFQTPQWVPSQCRLMALSGHENRIGECLLSEVKRTLFHAA